MVLFPDVPPAQPWEYVLVDKIFQKGGDGSQGIARYLSRHVRHSDHTPPGAILNAVNDALSPLGATVFAQPITPERVLKALGKY